MLGFTHFFNNDDNEMLNDLINQHGADGYGFYYALTESICSALDKDPDLDAVSIYRSHIQRRSGINSRKLTIILRSLEIIPSWSEIKLSCSEIKLSCCLVSIAKLPEIIAFRTYKISKVKATKYKTNKAKADVAGAVVDAPCFSGLPVDALTKKWRDEFGNEFIDTHLKDACDFFDNKVRKGDKDNWVYKSLQRAEEKFGCPHKINNELSNFDWNK
tara:strand:+ start:2202 stop:2849 length:648 start_codon:yes stop_codon:yes gene_type:complete